MTETRKQPQSPKYLGFAGMTMMVGMVEMDLEKKGSVIDECRWKIKPEKRWWGVFTKKKAQF